MARTSVVINRNTHIAQLLFEAKAPLYSFRIARSRNLTITLGIENHSKRTPRLKILDDAAVFMTGISQLNGASAAAAEITTADHAFLFFEGSSRGGNALVFNTGKSVVEFSGESSAEQMTITNRTGGKLYFEKKSTGDQAHIVNEAKGQFFCNKTKPFTLAIGRIDNDGLADLGFCTVEVAHSFAQGATGTLVVGVSKTSRFGALVVDKNATVGGTLDVDIDPAVPMPRTFKIVKAGGRRTGSFATLKIRGRKDVKGRLAYSSKEVSLIVEKK